MRAAANARRQHREAPTRFGSHVERRLCRAAAFALLFSCGCGGSNAQDAPNAPELSGGGGSPCASSPCNQPTDECPTDPNKKSPGMCGCGVAEGSCATGGVMDGAMDGCPDDPNKTQPGTCGCGQPESSTCQAAADAVIAGIYFAQTHVLPPDDPKFKLVSSRDALIKVHVTSATAGAAPQVNATLSLRGKTLDLPLKGPGTLPTEIPIGPGVVQHRYEDSFTATIPADWVQPGLSLVVKAGAAELNVMGLKIGAPTRVVLTMFDISYFKPTPGDYPAGWKEEIEAKWPVSAIELRRIPNVVFPEVVILPRGTAPATRTSSQQDYTLQTGQRFDGEQDAASQWVGALKSAAGTGGRVSLYYMNIYGVFAGGQAGGFGGVGNGKAAIVHHELGHALSLPHWGDSKVYPYKGDMFGIKAPNIYNGTHAGPTWAFDPMKGAFLPPTVQEGFVGSEPGKPSSIVPGTFKADPMQGGGSGDQEKGYIFRHFSDYSVNQMRGYLEKHVVVWNEALQSYASWNDAEGAYTTKVPNDGVQFAVERDVNVISVMAAVSGVTPKADLIYPPIGPYVAGLITLFDPSVAADRTSAAAIYCPAEGCDVSLRIVQGGKTKTYMLPISTASFSTRALNLPASDGAVTSVELLSTPDAEKVGLPASPAVLTSWKP